MITLKPVQSHYHAMSIQIAFERISTKQNNKIQVLNRIV